MSRSAVGWLGGSFDPVHEGHLVLARTARDRLGLERVLLIPAALPPHKLDRKLASGADRLALLELACQGEQGLEPCDIELQRSGPSYSYDTALALAERFGPDVELCFLIGADTLADLASWHRIQELAELVSFCSLTRPGIELDPSYLEPLLGDQAVDRLRRQLIHMAPHPASSTAIREALVGGQHVVEHLAPAVLAEIQRRGLYGAGGSSSRFKPSSKGT